LWGKEIRMSGREIELILFDLGNTLIYFDGDEEKSASVAARALTRDLIKNGLAVDPQTFPAEFQSAMKAYFARREQDCLELTSTYVLREELIRSGYLEPPAGALGSALQAMYAVSEAHWKMGDDTLATLTALRKQGFRLGIISNAADAADFHRLMEMHDLDQYFELALVSAEVGMRKPHPLIFQLALDFFGIQPEKACMVGDLPAMDIRGAQGMGIAGVWITRWLHPETGGKSLAGITPDAVISSLSEVSEVIDSWRGN
jgi:putative hydrolase of the HAD superfamily